MHPLSFLATTIVGQSIIPLPAAASSPSCLSECITLKHNKNKVPPKRQCIKDFSSSSSDESDVMVLTDDVEANVDDFIETFGEEEELGKKFDLRSSIGEVFTEDGDDPALESLRMKTAAIDPSCKLAVSKNMERLFNYRVSQCYNKSVREELLLYPHLRQAEIIYQEAMLTWREYCKTPHSDYTSATFSSLQLAEKLEGVILKWRVLLENSIQRHRQAAPFIGVTAGSKEMQLKLGLIFLAVKLRVIPFQLFNHNNPVYILGEHNNIENQWKGVVVNGEELAGDGTRECITMYFSSFPAFNLIHPKNVESLLEMMEAELGIRKRVTRKTVQQLRSSCSERRVF